MGGTVWGRKEKPLLKDSKKVTGGGAGKHREISDRAALGGSKGEEGSVHRWREKASWGTG